MARVTLRHARWAQHPRVASSREDSSHRDFTTRQERTHEHEITNKARRHLHEHKALPETNTKEHRSEQVEIPNRFNAQGTIVESRSSLYGFDNQEAPDRWRLFRERNDGLVNHGRHRQRRKQLSIVQKCSKWAWKGTI